MSVARSNHYRVLVADDDAGCRESIVNLLVHDGFEASAVSEGHAAIRALRSPVRSEGDSEASAERASSRRRTGSGSAPRAAGFDFVVLDYNLPDLTGLEILRVVRRDLCLELPAILVTGDFSLDLERSVLEIGGFAVMKKPVHPGNFRETVWDLVRRHFKQS